MTFGFRKSKSCLDNLSLLIFDVQIAFTNNQSTHGCFVEDNAYNNDDLGPILTILGRLDVGAKICC